MSAGSDRHLLRVTRELTAMKDGEELHVSCTTCKRRTAIVRQVATDLGSVKIRECMVCDRARCTACNTTLPGWAKKCPSSVCGQLVAMPSPSALSNRMHHPSTYVARLDEAQRLVDGFAGVAHHPHLAEAKERLADMRRAA